MAGEPEALSARGACFGLEVRSRLPFRYLRDGSASPLVVDEGRTSAGSRDAELVAEWPADGRVASRLYRDDERSHYWIDGPGWFDVAPRTPSITLPDLPPSEVRRQIAPGVSEDELLAWREVPMWGIPAMLCFVERGGIPIHAASVDVGGVAVLLGAPGTFGKTTLSAAFHAAGHRLLSDDISCCALSRDPVVLPGPAMLRIRRDVYERMAFPDARVAFENTRRVTLTIDPRRRGDASAVPLRGIVLLRRPDSGGVRLARAEPAEAIRDLLALCFTAVLDRARAFREVASLVATTPVWYLTRRLDYDELPAVVERIATACTEVKA